MSPIAAFIAIITVVVVTALVFTIWSIIREPSPESREPDISEGMLIGGTSFGKAVAAETIGNEIMEEEVSQQHRATTYDAPDLHPLFDDENPDLGVEIRNVCGDWWLTAPNVHLGGRTPEEVIKENHGARVREIIRQMRYVGI